MNDGTLLLFPRCCVDFRFRVLDDVHSRLDDVRFNGDGDGADFGHALLGRVLGIFDKNALTFVRLCPVLGEEAVAYPFVTRSVERLGENTTFAHRLVFLSSQVFGLRNLDGG